ncbi:hypothetical protein K7G98_38120, partial [Saccharothrix sp. MB29]|nr:hypothetical protein [Saccharothrix sp. MB29]
MKAIAQNEFGDADVLVLQELPRQRRRLVRQAPLGGRDQLRVRAVLHVVLALVAEHLVTDGEPVDGGPDCAHH